MSSPPRPFQENLERARLPHHDQSQAYVLPLSHRPSGGISRMYQHFLPKCGERRMPAKGVLHKGCQPFLDPLRSSRTSAIDAAERPALHATLVPFQLRFRNVSRFPQGNRRVQHATSIKPLIDFRNPLQARNIENRWPSQRFRQDLPANENPPNKAFPSMASLLQ